MLLRRYTDFETRLALAQLSGVLAVIGLVAGGSLGNSSVFSLFMNPSGTLDFLCGFVAGLSGVLLGLSLVLSTAALLALRKTRSTSR
jgi:hypothetical protein